jgi:predicted permease
MSILQDIRHSLRMLFSRPAVMLTVVATLALGIGANTAVFSAITDLLLMPLPYPESGRLVYIYNTYPKMGVEYAGMTVPDYLDRRSQADALADSAIYYDYSYDLTGDQVPQRVAGVAATPSLFTTLGVQAAIGRTFDEGEAIVGHDAVVLLSDSLWRNHFWADATIVGSDISLSGRSYRVVGVMPASFAFPRREVALWVPFVFSERQKSDAMRGFEFAESIGRLKPGASIRQLDDQFDAIVAHNLKRFADSAASPSDFVEHATASGFTGRARSLHDQLVGDVGTLLYLLQVAAALVLGIGCANVANLMLIRASARQRELGMRAALGATFGRIARQLVIECLALTLIGGVAGFVVAYAGIDLMRTLGLDQAARGFAIGLHLPVLGAALACAVTTGLLIAVAPLMMVRDRRFGIGLSLGARGTTGSRATTAVRRMLVATQIALAIALLMNAALLIRSFWNVERQYPGFNSDHLVTANVNLARDRYRDNHAVGQFEAALVNAVRALPDVMSVGVVGGIPFSDDNDGNPYFIEGHETEGSRSAYMQVADEGFYAAMQIPLLRGRTFQSTDNATTQPVAIIDEALARKNFGDADPIGSRIGTRSLNGIAWRTIVGVVGSVKRHKLSETDDASTCYFAYGQGASRIFRLAIRIRPGNADLSQQLRAAAAAIDPGQPVWGIMTMDDRIRRSLDDRRTPMWIVLIFATIAAGLCALGIYGVLAFWVAQRTREIGVHIALGAGRREVARLVMTESGLVVLMGVVLGSGLALGLALWMRSQLFGVDALDMPTLVVVIALVASIALIASWLPARRAARIDPIQALQYE